MWAAEIEVEGDQDFCDWTVGPELGHKVSILDDYDQI